jgi:RND superfamily putative drug exporter
LDLVASLAFALAVGVLVDAFLVRMIIVPATLMLVGKASWWIPAWLDKILPTIDTEGRTLEGTHERRTRIAPAMSAAADD